MASIGHLIVGIIIGLLLYHISNKKFTKTLIIYFIIGSILPDILVVLKTLNKSTILIWNPIHSLIGWCFFSIIFIGLLKILDIKTPKFSIIYLTLISAGMFHFGLDMMSEPVRIIGNFYVSIWNLYTPYGIFGEQDVITILYTLLILYYY